MKSPYPIHFFYSKSPKGRKKFFKYKNSFDNTVFICLTKCKKGYSLNNFSYYKIFRHVYKKFCGIVKGDYQYKRTLNK